MVNKVILLGNLGQDPEVRHLESGAVVARFSLATNETYKDRTTGERKTLTEWHNVVVWRGLAEVAEKYLKKGDSLYVEGKLTHRKYQDANGNDRYTTEIVANNFQMLGGKDRAQSPSGAPMPSAEPKTNATPQNTAPQKSDSDNPFLEEDDLPF